MVSNLSDLLTSLIFGEQPERFAHFFNKQTYIIHSKKKITKILAKIFERIAHLLIYHEQPEGIAHSRSFVIDS